MKTNAQNKPLDPCLPLCKIRGIAELFSTVLPDETRDLSSDACAGIFMTLQSAANEIQEIFDSVVADLEAEKEAEKKARERQARKLYDIRCGEVNHGNF